MRPSAKKQSCASLEVQTGADEPPGKNALLEASGSHKTICGLRQADRATSWAGAAVQVRMHWIQLGPVSAVLHFCARGEGDEELINVGPALKQPRPQTVLLTAFCGLANAEFSVGSTQ